jgi:NAD+ synthase
MKYQTIADYIQNWLNDYKQNAQCKGFVVGVSGGVDSALVSTLCARTESPTLLVSLPIHQNSQEHNRAISHVNWLKEKHPCVESLNIDLTESFESLKNSLPQTAQDHALSMANTRARLRMTTLYALAGSRNLLVVGTGNKVEDFGIGFFTKYGDGGVDISPIADLYKSEVRKIAHYLGVHQDLANAVSTDGLFANSPSDEAQIGASYDELEWAMAYEKTKSQQVLSEREKIVLNIYNTRNQANKHKIEPIPVCIIPKELL